MQSTRALTRSTLGLILAILGGSLSCHGIILTPTSYTYTNGGPHANYPDPGRVELTDGHTFNIAWGGGAPINAGDVVGLSGWDGRAPGIAFAFASTVTITDVTVWAADSDGAAAVYLPTSITLSTPGGFSQVFPVTNPVGSGSTVPIALSGFSVTTNSLTVSLTPAPANRWTMLSEVEFASNIPEPGQTAVLMAAGSALGACLWRRQRRVS